MFYYIILYIITINCNYSLPLLPFVLLFISILVQYHYNYTQLPLTIQLNQSVFLSVIEHQILPFMLFDSFNTTPLRPFVINVILKSIYYSRFFILLLGLFHTLFSLLIVLSLLFILIN